MLTNRLTSNTAGAGAGAASIDLSIVAALAHLDNVSIGRLLASVHYDRGHYAAKTQPNTPTEP